MVAAYAVVPPKITVNSPLNQENRILVGDSNLACQKSTMATFHYKSANYRKSRVARHKILKSKGSQRFSRNWKMRSTSRRSTQRIAVRSLAGSNSFGPCEIDTLVVQNRAAAKFVPRPRGTLPSYLYRTGVPTPRDREGMISRNVTEPAQSK